MHGEMEIALADTDTCAKQLGPALAFVIACGMAMSQPALCGRQHAAGWLQPSPRQIGIHWSGKELCPPRKGAQNTASTWRS